MRPSLWQILIVVILALILFGHNKFPDMMKNLAGGIKVFKKELKEDDNKKSSAAVKTAPKRAASKKTAAKKTSKSSAGKK